jgi:hypothetical protein
MRPLSGADMTTARKKAIQLKKHWQLCKNRGLHWALAVLSIDFARKKQWMKCRHRLKICINLTKSLKECHNLWLR